MTDFGVFSTEVCATATLVCVRLAFVLYMNNSFETFWRDSVETYDATAEGLKSFNMFFLRTLRVDNEDLPNSCEFRIGDSESGRET